MPQTMSALDRFEALKAQQAHLLFFALVDGLVEQAHGAPMQHEVGCAALFTGTEDAALAAAGRRWPLAGRCGFAARAV